MKQKDRQSEQQLVRNVQANEIFTKREYPNEKFISDNSEFQSKNRFTKGLVIPENVKVAESRVPISAEQRRTLYKELVQADVSIHETRRRIGLVLNRHPEYTGTIIVSIGGKNPYFWDTSSFK